MQEWEQATLTILKRVYDGLTSKLRRLAPPGVQHGRWTHTGACPALRSESRRHLGCLAALLHQPWLGGSAGPEEGGS